MPLVVLDGVFEQERYRPRRPRVAEKIHDFPTGVLTGLVETADELAYDCRAAPPGRRLGRPYRVR